MAESNGPVSPDTLSPSLGGERATPEPEADTTQSNPFGPEFADLFGAEAGAEFEQLAQTFGLFGQTLQSLVTETLQVFETRLPQTLAAFEGLIDAVNQALDDQTTAAPPPAETSTESVEAQDQDA